MEIQKKQVIHIYSFEAYSSMGFRYATPLASFQLKFVDKEFESCSYSFMDMDRGTNIYTRDQWRVLKYIEEKITEIEAQYAAEQK